MKVSKCLMSIFFVMSLYQAAVAIEQFDLLPCTESDGRGMPCTEYDSTADMCYLHDNIARRMTIKLPVLVLTQLWLNQGEIAIADMGGEVINNGQEFTRSQDRDRWTIIFNFQHVHSDFGKLQLDFHIEDVRYIDEQYLHVEIRTEDNIFVTRNSIWFPVQVKLNNGDNDHEGEVTTTDNPACEDPSRARIETLENKTEVLQQQLDDLEGILFKHESTGRTLHIITVLLLLGLIVAHGIFMLKGSKVVHKTMNLDDITPNQMIPIQPNNEVTFKKFNGEKLHFTIQNEL